MLKHICRTLSPATDRCPTDRIYGHPTPDAQERFLAGHPDARALDAIQLTPRQQGDWRSFGQWEDDWHGRRFVEAGSLLRWPEDSREPRTPSAAEYAGLFAAAAAASDPDEFVHSWANHYNFGGDPAADQPEAVTRFLRRLWNVAHWGIGEICDTAGITMTELSQLTLKKYRTLQNWSGGQSQFRTEDRYLLLHLLDLLPRL